MKKNLGGLDRGVNVIEAALREEWEKGIEERDRCGEMKGEGGEEESVDVVKWEDGGRGSDDEW